MLNKLMIRRTMLRQPGLYLKLLICLTCAVMLISCLLIYHDSEAYGKKQVLYERTRNADIAISGLAEADVRLFPLADRSHFYENGTLYITLDNNDSIDIWIGKLRKTVSENQLSCEITNNYYINRSDTPELTIMLMVATVVLAIFSAISMAFMYRAFLHAREKDIHTLYRLGATSSQIQSMLRIELSILSSVALVMGVVLANVIMYIGINRFLHVENESYAMISYHYSAWSMLATVAIVLCIHIVAGETGIRRLKRLNFEKDTFFEKRPVLWKEKSLDIVYTLISLQRNRSHNRVCFLVTVPIIVIGIFVSAYMGMYTPTDSAQKTGDIVLYRNIESENKITLETFEALLSGHEAVEQVSYFTYRTDYSLVLREKNVALVTSVKDSEGYEVTLAEFGIMEDWLMEQYCGETSTSISSLCVVPQGYGLTTGDTVQLRKGDDNVSLVVGGTYDTGKRDPSLKMFPVYVTKDTYEKATAEQAVPYVVSIYLRDTSDGDAVFDILPSEIYEAYSIRNNFQNKQDFGQIYAGFSYILSIMAASICLVEGMLIFSYISLHIDEEKHEIVILSKLGCKNKRIFKLYLYQYIFRYVATLVVGLLLAGLSVAYLSESLHKSVVYNMATILPPVFMIGILLVAYIGSVIISVKSSLKEIMVS